MAKEKYNILCADFECWMCNGINCPLKIKHDKAKVWLAGWKYLYDDKLHSFIDIESWFFNIIETVDNPVVYFHNGGKYDVFFIFDLLITKLGFKPIDKINEIKTKERKHFKMFAANNIVYDCQIFYKNKKLILRDSIRLLTFSIEKLGGKTKGKFNNFEKYGHKEINNINELTEQELYTFNEDIDIMRANLKADLFYGSQEGLKNLLPMTIAALGYKDQKETIPFIRENLNNKLTLEQWDYFINFFRGGIVYTNPKFEGKVIEGTIRHYDVNSLYPTMLKDEYLPYSIPLKHKPLFGSYVCCYKILISKAELKPNHIPYIGVYKSELTENDIYNELLDDDTYNYPPIITNLTYYVFDFELDFIKKQYDISYKILQKDFFMTKNYLKEWIEKLELLKIQYTITGDKVNRNAVKLLMNGGGFGKQGQKRTSRTNIFKRISEQEKNDLRKNSIYYEELNTDYYWHFTTETRSETSLTKLKYCPLAAFITAKSRVYISEFRQKYFEWFIYGDTDDMYLLNKELNPKYLDNWDDREGKFGLFSYEPYDDLWEKMYIHGSKKYMLYRKDRNIVKFAGFMMENVNMSFDEFVKADTFKDAKTIKNYVNGVPTIHRKDGILRKRR